VEQVIVVDNSVAVVAVGHLPPGVLAGVLVVLEALVLPLAFQVHL
jgi:hypothetical protein